MDITSTPRTFVLEAGNFQKLGHTGLVFVFRNSTLPLTLTIDMGCLPSSNGSTNPSTPLHESSPAGNHNPSQSRPGSQEGEPDSTDNGLTASRPASTSVDIPTSRADQLKAYFEACSDLVRIDEPFTRFETQQVYVQEHCPLPSRSSRVWGYYDDKKQAHRRHHRAVLTDLRAAVNPDETARTEAFKRASELHSSLGVDGEMSVGIARAMVCHLTAIDAEAMSFRHGPPPGVEGTETADNQSACSTADERRNTIDGDAQLSLRWPWSPQFGQSQSLLPSRKATEEGCDEGAIDVESGCWKCSWVRDARKTIEGTDPEWRVSTYMETTPYAPSPAVPSDDRRQVGVAESCGFVHADIAA